MDNILYRFKAYVQFFLAGKIRHYLKMDKALEVRNLSKSFKKHFWSSPFTALKDVSFSVPRAGATGFLGSNGAGKTTAFKCLLNLIKKDAGEALFFNAPLNSKTCRRIGFLPERPQFYGELTAEECLLFHATLSGIPLSKAKPALHSGLKKSGLYKWKDKKLKNFSKGMIQKIGLLQALIHEPDLIILDEPFAGLDPESRLFAIELLEERVQKGCSLFLSSHILQDVEKICNHLIIIKEGRIIFEGACSDFICGGSSKLCLVYILKGKKHSLTVHSQEEGQKELKNLLSQGAVILSLQKESGDLEQRYKKLMGESL